MRHRPRARRFAIGEWICVLFVLLPPAVRVLRDQGRLDAWWPPARLDAARERERRAQLADAASTSAHLRASQTELVTLTRIARGLFGEKATPIGRMTARYSAQTVDVVALSDPSPTRHAIWVSLAGVELPAVGGQQVDAAALSGSSLVGRFASPAIAGWPLGRITSLLDPLFRVRFVAGDARGVLWGTGRRDGEGRPLLEARHLTSLRPLPAGTPVTTDGEDGVFPPSLAIGEIAPTNADDGGRVLVSAYERPEDLRQVVLLTDLTPRTFIAELERTREASR